MSLDRDMTMDSCKSRGISRAAAAVVLITCTAAVLGAQVPASEFAARRDSLAHRIGDGVLVALGGRTPITDFGPFYQLPAFHYLTDFDEPDAAFMLVARGGRAQSILFLTPVDPRKAFYYGRRPDSTSVTRTLGVGARSFAALPQVVDSLVSSGLPLYTLNDFSDADFAREDSLTRGRAFTTQIAKRHPGLVVKDAHPFLDALRAKKSEPEMALLRKAAEISSEGHPLLREEEAVRAVEVAHRPGGLGQEVECGRRVEHRPHCCPLYRHRQPRYSRISIAWPRARGRRTARR